MAKITDGTLRDWKNGDVVSSDAYEQDREILKVAVNDTDNRVDEVNTNLTEHDTRLSDLEVNITGTIVPTTFKELGMQNITFDQIKLGYIDYKLSQAFTGDNVIDLLKPVEDQYASRLLDVESDLSGYNFLENSASFYTTLSLPVGLIMQGFYFSQDGKYIFAVTATGTGDGSTESFTLYRLTSTGKYLDQMTLTNCGHGTVLGIEDSGTDTYVWSNVGDSGTTNKLVRFQYTAGATYTFNSSVELVEYPNFGSGEYVYPCIDGDSIIICRKISGNWIVEKRNLSDIKSGINNIVKQVSIPASLVWLQGFTADGDDLYWYSGDNNGATYPIKISRFSFTTGLLVSELPVNFGENNLGVAENSYKEPEGIFMYKDSSGAKSLFVGIVTGDSKQRYNKIFGFQSLINFKKFYGFKQQDVITDIPWNTLTLTNGTTQWSYPVQYRRVGNRIQLKGAVGSFTTGAVIGTLPVGYRSARRIRKMAAGDGSFNASRVTIDESTGNITVDLGTSVTTVWLDMEFDAN